MTLATGMLQPLIESTDCWRDAGYAFGTIANLTLASGVVVAGVMSETRPGG